jgi:6-phosphogluconolactonase
LILLGLGEDGHTASLFPGSDALEETERLVVAVCVEKVNSFRLTLTLPVLNQGAQIIFLVAGDGKAKVVNELLGTKRIVSTLPAAKVRPQNGQLTCLVTEDAARKVACWPVSSVT